MGSYEFYHMKDIIGRRLEDLLCMSLINCRVQASYAFAIKLVDSWSPCASSIYKGSFCHQVKAGLEIYGGWEAWITDCAVQNV